MQRTAAVMLGVALVALSIGVNTARYPVVWEMVRPMGASEATEATGTADAAKGTAAAMEGQPASESLESPRPIELPSATQGGTDGGVHVAAGLSLSGTDAGNPGSGQKALVPVLPVGLSMSSSDGTAESGIRRLPPVTSGWANPSAESYGNSIPVYPTTGIE